MASITPEELNVLIEQTYKVENEFNELKASYSHLQNTVEKVVEFLPNAIWIVNSDNTIFLQNSRARELWNLLNLLEFDGDDYEVSYENCAYLIKSSSYQDKFMISAIDITEQKRKENLATMGQMAAHLSHEIRNPVGSISLLSSTLKKRVKPENIAIVQEIQNSIYKIERIIKATLMFSKGVQASKNKFNWMKLQDNLTLACGYYGHSKDISFKLLDEDFFLEADFDLLEFFLQTSCLML
ncbi:histidine kinase dimerization/phospho-acceptor domain-containing protein [Sulfurimonas sp.]